MKFAHVLGTINGFILLFIFYFVIIGIYALAQQIIKLFFGKKIKKDNSYWQKKEELGDGLENLTYQF